MISGSSQKIQGEAFLDKEGFLHGWCWDPANPTVRLQVEILRDGTRVRRISAARFREDLREGGVGDGYHSFAVMLPGAVRGKNFPGHASLREVSTGLVFWQINALNLAPYSWLDKGVHSISEKMRRLSEEHETARRWQKASTTALGLQALAERLKKFSGKIECLDD